MPRRPLACLALVLLLLPAAACDRERLFAGPRLDVELDWDWLHAHVQRRPLPDLPGHAGRAARREPESWLPMPSEIPGGDPRAALIGLGVIIGLAVVVVVVNEVVEAARNGRIQVGTDLVDTLQLRIACDGRLYVADLVPGGNRLVLTPELDAALRSGAAVVNVYSTGRLQVNHSFRPGVVADPERCQLRLVGDGHAYLDDACVD